MLWIFDPKGNSMVVSFYFAVFVLSIIMLISFLVRNKKVDTLLILFSMMVSLNCVGRYLLAISESLQMALISNTILYLGGCFTPMLTVMILAKLCEHKIPTVLKFFMISFSTLVMCLVLTIGKYDIYYKHVELAFGDGYSYLVKEYGPFHTLYPLMMMMYAVIMLGYLSYAIRKRKQLSFRIVMTLCICCLAIIVVYILERIAGSNISFLSLGYLAGIMLLINYFDRLNIYDMSSNIISAIERMSEYGYIVFDDKYRYVSANAYLKELFPEIRDYCVDAEVKDSDSFFYREIIRYLYDWREEKAEIKTVVVDEKYFDVEIRIISHGRKKRIGYLVEFTDRTIEKRYYSTIEDYNASLEKEVEQKTENILYIKDMMVLGMADMVESRDNNTGGHIKRTSAVVKIFAERLKDDCDRFQFDTDFLRSVVKAAPMHDLGKIAIDDVILRKPGKYTPEEFAQMKKHAAEGARIVGNILQGVEDDRFVRIAKNVANYHHEKWNGQGYPEGLSGENIPIEARIMALADVFDALVSKRCYKEAFSYEKAFRIIEESLGQHFDPDLGKIFIECRPELEEIYNQVV